MNRLIYLLAPLFLLLLVPSVSALNITGCTSLNTPNTVHDLKNDVYAPGDCMTVDDDNNMIFDGNGYTVYCGYSCFHNNGFNKIENFTMRNVNIVLNGSSDVGENYALAMTTLTNVTMENVTITGNKPNKATSGLLLCPSGYSGGCIDVTVRDFTFQGNGTGIQSTLNNFTNTDVRFEDIIINNSRFFPITIENVTGGYIDGINTYTTNPDNQGFQVKTSTNFNISNAVIGGNTPGLLDGIYVSYYSGNMENINIIVNDVGIYIDDNSNVTIDGVNITAGYESILAQAGSYVDIENVTLYGTAGSGQGTIGIYSTSNGGTVNDFYIDNSQATNLHGVVCAYSGGCIIENGEIYYGTYGVYVRTYGVYVGSGVTGASVRNVYVEGVSQEAFRVFISNNNLFEYCEAQDVGRGWLIYQSNNNTVRHSNVDNTTSSNGFNSWESNYTIFYNLTANDTELGAIGFGGSSKPSYHGWVEDCYGSYGGHGTSSGIFIIGAVNLTVINSEFSNNLYGVGITKFDGFVNYVRDVWIYNNSIHDNVANANVSYIDFDNINFNSSTLGNYWDDYTGCDDNGDGIGETNYTINATEGIYDNLPLTTLSCTVPPTPPTPPVDNLPGGFGGLAAVIIAAVWLLFMLDLFLSEKIRTELVIVGIITLLVMLTLVSFFLLG